MTIAAMAALALSGAASAGPRALKTQSVLMLTPIAMADVAMTKGSFLKAGSFIANSQLVPPSLLRLDTAAVDPATGKEMAPAGTQLIPQRVEDGTVNHCTAKRMRGNFSTPRIMLCFVGDPDSGGFDRFFWTWGVPLGGPGASFMEANKVAPLARVAVSRIDPKAFAQDVSVRLQWTRGDGIAKPAVLDVLLCEKERCPMSARSVRMDMRPGAAPLRILGSDLSCTKTGETATCTAVPTGERPYLLIDGWQITLEDDWKG